MTSLIFGHASLMVAGEILSLPGAEFFVFRRAASISCNVISERGGIVV